MRLFINGEEQDVPAPQTVASLLGHIGFAGRRMAVEVNREIVPRSRQDTHALADGDRVEFIQAIGGG